MSLLYELPLKIFGCIAYVHIQAHNGTKLDLKGIRCMFIGYLGTQKRYKCYCPTTKKMYTTLHVTFNETQAVCENITHDLVYESSKNLIDLCSYTPVFTDSQHHSNQEISQKQSQEPPQSKVSPRIEPAVRDKLSITKACPHICTAHTT